MKTRKIISVIVTLSMIASCFTFLSVTGGAAASNNISLTYNFNGMTSIAIDTANELAADKIGAYATHLIGIANSNGRCLTPVDDIKSERYSLDPNTPSTYGTNAMFPGVKPEGTELGHSSRVVYNPYVAYKISADSGMAIDQLTVDLEYILAPFNHVRSEIGLFVTDDFDAGVNTTTGEFDFSDSVLGTVLCGNDRSVSTANVDMRASKDGPMTVDLTNAVKKLSDTSEVYVIVVLMRGASDLARVRLYSLAFSATQKEDEGAGDSVLSINAGIAAATVTDDYTKQADPAAIKAFYVHNVTVGNGSVNNALIPLKGMSTANYDLDPDNTINTDNGNVRFGAQPENIANENALYNSYVAYKLSAGEGKVVDSLKVDISYYLRVVGNLCFYQVGVWVANEFSHDANGAYDFTANDYAALLTSSDTAGVGNHKNPVSTQLDLDDAVKALNSRDIYVIILLNRGYEESTDQGTTQRMGVTALKLTATEGEPAAAPALPGIIASISDEAGDDKIDHLYLNAAISASETRQVGIIFSDTEASCEAGAKPLFIRVAEEGHGKSAGGFIQSGCYGSNIILAEHLGGEEGDSVIAVYWQEMPTGTLYARTFAKNSDGTYDYGAVAEISLSDGTNALPLAYLE
ncbi:MAG: hypothetical protein IJU75_03800 [Clostridia bacterium]|nr:hypothetical protein [Clostridia bacterium]